MSLRSSWFLFDSLFFLLLSIWLTSRFLKDLVENWRVFGYENDTKKNTKHNSFHLQSQLLHTMLSATAHKQAEGWESCHRNVYKSRPEECKQNWVKLLSDKRVNFRQSCFSLPVWSFNYNTAHWRIIFSEWMIVSVFQSLYNQATWMKNAFLFTGIAREWVKVNTQSHTQCLAQGHVKWMMLREWRELLILPSGSQQGFRKRDAQFPKQRLSLWRVTVAHHRVRRASGSYCSWKLFIEPDRWSSACQESAGYVR